MKHWRIFPLLGLALTALLAQKDNSTVYGDPEIEKPPTKAYREAIRVRGVGVKVGEVTSRSAILWSRVPPTDEVHFDSKKDLITWLSALFVEEDNQIRMRYGLNEDFSDAAWTNWLDTDDANDYCHQWKLSNLQPGRTYHYEVEAADKELKPLYEVRRGKFRTAPSSATPAAVTFTVVTGQRYDRLDDPRGFNIYPAMQALDPDFLVLTGDTVYMDRGPVKARNIELARDRWRRTDELPRLFDFFALIPAYYEKDDHDILTDDVWPGSKDFGEVSFDDGVQIFKDHTPWGGQPYRTVRWGQLLQIWLTEVREFRSDSQMPDGPMKSIFGERQKRWLKQSLIESDAEWKVLINPTPILGPDRKLFKRDNHANDAWQHEGDEMRGFFSETLGEKFVILSGDRHWQYHSVDPATGLQEYACGPATDEHAGGSPGWNRRYHRFHRVGGGFVSATAAIENGRSVLEIRLHDTNGAVVYANRHEAYDSAP